jgi:precorrin-2 dehydrogenase/sirohydrochlorin ferrochelatase
LVAMTEIYPISLLIEGRQAVVVGGGEVAERKVLSLLEARAAVRVVAPEATPRLRSLAAEGAIVWRPGQATEADIADAFVVILATDDPDLNARMAAVAQGMGKLVNAVDQPEACNFFVPASVRRGPLVITVATGGASPALAKRIRREVETRFGPEYGELADLLAGLRASVSKQQGAQPRRARDWERVLDSPVLELLREGRRAEAEALARSLLESEPTPEDDDP